MAEDQMDEKLLIANVQNFLYYIIEAFRFGRTMHRLAGTTDQAARNKAIIASFLLLHSPQL